MQAQFSAIRDLNPQYMMENTAHWMCNLLSFPNENTISVCLQK